MHMNLHPDDIREVLEKGWGQRHPLARKGWWFFGSMPVPEDFVMIYAPRGELTQPRYWLGEGEPKKSKPWKLPEYEA